LTIIVVVEILKNPQTLRLDASLSLAHTTRRAR